PSRRVCACRPASPVGENRLMKPRDVTANGDGISRRKFLGTTLAGSATLLAGGSRLSQSFHSCRTHAGRQTGGPLDVQRISERTEIAGFGLRSGAGDKTADAIAISRVRSTGAAGCRDLCELNGRSGAEISEWPSKDLASHWNWQPLIQ